MSSLKERLSMPGQLFHVGFCVSDLDKSLPFYVDTLGFKLNNRWEETNAQTDLGMGVPGCSLELAQLEGYGIVLELFVFKDAAGSPVPPAPNQVGCAHLSIGVGDMNEFVAKLKERGDVEFVSDPMRLTIGQWVFIKDPDGILVEIMGLL